MHKYRIQKHLHVHIISTVNDKWSEYNESIIKVYKCISLFIY